MEYLATFSLDDLANTNTMAWRLKSSGRLDNIDYRILRGFMTTLADYLIERGTDTRFVYIVTDTDLDTVIDMFLKGFKT